MGLNSILTNFGYHENLLPGLELNLLQAYVLRM